MREIARLMLMGLVAATAFEISGQSGPPEAPAGPGHRGPRDEAGRMVDAYIISNLQESLSLTDDQFLRALPPVKRLLDDRRRFLSERRRILATMRRDLGANPVDEKRIAAELNELKRIEAEATDAQRRNAEAVDGVLTPLQQAKFRILEGEVEQRIRAVVRERRTQGQSGGRRGPAPPDPD